MKISKGTIVRTVLLALSIVNNLLALFGKAPLPISDEQIELVISTVITIIVAVVNWWKNNSFTRPAIQGDQLMNRLRKNEV